MFTHPQKRNYTKAKWYQSKVVTLSKSLSNKFLTSGLVGCGIISQICIPSEANSWANSIPNTKNKLAITSTNLLSHQPPKKPSISVPENLVVDRFTPAKTSVSELDNNPQSTPVTSVSELSDVKPTDWAYQALQSLIERYGVVTGYSDKTFRGNRPISRYEFAAALAATLDRVDSLVGNAIGNQYIQDDVITLRRLQKEFRTALDDLHNRVDGLEIRNARLQAQQFSMTTKLRGQEIVAFSDGTFADKTVISRTRLTLSSSFHQQDLLITQLESGNNGGDAIGLAQSKKVNLLGVNGLIADGGGLDYTGIEPNFRLRRFYYTFRPQKDLALTVGAKMSPRDFIDYNTYANNEAIDFSNSFFIRNPLIVQDQIDRDGGAGVAIAWNPQGGKLTLRSLYIAGNAQLPNSNHGFFGDSHQASAELQYLASKKLALRLQYTNALINNTNINAFGVNTEYTFNRNIGIFGRFGYGNYAGFNTVLSRNLDLHPFSWAVGLNIHDLFIPGTIAGFALGQPFVSSGLGNATQTNFEAFYNLELSDNISVTPSLSVVSNPNNSSHGTIWETSLRTVFSF